LALTACGRSHPGGEAEAIFDPIADDARDAGAPAPASRRGAPSPGTEPGAGTAGRRGTGGVPAPAERDAGVAPRDAAVAVDATIVDPIDAGPAGCAVDNGGCGDPAAVRCVSTTSGAYCVDIDECAAAPNGGCGDPAFVTCLNYEGGYSCSDTPECETDNGGCGDPAYAHCVELFASPPECVPNECFPENGGCGDTALWRCEDGPDSQRVCKAKVVAIEPWPQHTCVLRADRSIDCWDMLGARYQPIQSGSFTQIANDGVLFCAIDDAGALHCPRMREEYVDDIPTSSDFIAISGGTLHMCGLRSGGLAACWGRDDGGISTGPNAEPGGLRQISASAFTTCVLRDSGSIRCWGTDSAGEVTAANGDPGSDFTAVAAGFDNICALHAGGTPVCWGSDANGQLSGLAQVAGTSFTAISVGGRTICGLRSDTSVSCWGWDQYGQTSGPNAAGTGIAQLKARSGMTCLVWTDGTFRCFGQGSNAVNRDAWAR
jgi:hypothetical protein